MMWVSPEARSASFASAGMARVSPTVTWVAVDGTVSRAILVLTVADAALMDAMIDGIEVVGN